MKRRRPEDAIQKAVLHHLEARAVPGVFYFHTPSGGYRRPVEAAILRGLGARSGIPDLVLIHQGRTYGLELKAEGGRITPVQATAHVLMREAGAEVAVAVGIDAAVAVLERWQLLRGTADLRGAS